ncbi:MAG: flagellar biosynthetic protein FliO [Desulfatitalea sp.]|nr:flagellar biosynthetic protein FliO [Desulfatitalea sp.]NNK00936.1 flagellar biosynthetic protein FliO [Desulfatitalea sp.]
MTGAPDVTMAAVKMFLSLAAVLAVLWGIHRWSRRSFIAQPGRGGGRWVKMLGHHYLGPKKSIAVVQVPGTVLVLGVGSEQVNLLTRIDDPELLAGLDEQETAKSGGKFAEQLQRLLRPMKLTQSQTGNQEGIR